MAVIQFKSSTCRNLNFLVFFWALSFLCLDFSSAFIKGDRTPRNLTRIVHFPFADASAVIDTRTRHGAFWDLVESESWEPTTFLVFNTVITHLTTVIDFGAWIGPTALYAAHFAKQVYALEPDIVAYKEAHRNINLNADRLPNIHLYHKCISTKREAVKMNPGPTAPGDSMSTINRSAMIGIPVQCDTLSQLAIDFHLQVPVFVKVDTEGLEAELVPSWSDFIEIFTPTIFLSMHQQLRKYSKIDEANVLRILRMFPYALEVSGCARCDNIFTSVFFNKTETKLCINCDYLLSFKRFFVN